MSKKTLATVVASTMAMAGTALAAAQSVGGQVTFESDSSFGEGFNGSVDVVAGQTALNFTQDQYSKYGGVTYESFGNVDTSTAKEMTFTFNALASKGNGFLEKVFPTVVLSPKEVSLEVSTDKVTFYGEVKRTLLSGVNAGMGEFGQVPVADVARSANKLLSTNTLEIATVYRQGTDIFADDLKKTIVHNGSDVEVAPLAFGKEINLLTVGQTDAVLATGVISETSTLSTQLGVKEVFVRLGDATDYVICKVDTTHNSTAIFSALGDKATTMSLDGTVYATLRAKDIVKTGGTGAIPAGVGVKVKIKLSGSADTQSGVVSIAEFPVAFIGAVDANGVALPKTDQDYITTNDMVKSSALIGFYPDAAYANLNHSNVGLLLDVTGVSKKVFPGFLTPVSMKLTANAPRDEVAKALSDVIYFSTMLIDAAGVQTILSKSAYLKANSDKGDLGMVGIESNRANPFYFSDDIDVDALVNSMASDGKKADVGGALQLLLGTMAIKMLTESSYLALNGNKGEVVFGTSGLIAGFLPSTFEANSAVTVHIEAMDYEEFDNRVIGVPYVPSTDGDVSPLNAGVKAYVPVQAVDTVRSFGKESVHVVTAQPCVKHAFLNDIMVDITLTNADKQYYKA